MFKVYIIKKTYKKGYPIIADGNELGKLIEDYLDILSKS